MTEINFIQAGQKYSKPKKLAKKIEPNIEPTISKKEELIQKLKTAKINPSVSHPLKNKKPQIECPPVLEKKPFSLQVLPWQPDDRGVLCMECPKASVRAIPYKQRVKFKFFRL